MRPSAWVVLVSLISVVQPAWSADELPAPIMAAMLLKLLGFEKGIAQRQGEIVIGVVFDAQTPASAAAEKALRESFAKLGGERVQNRGIRSVSVDVRNLASQAAEVLILTPALEPHLPKIVGHCSTKKILCIGPSSAYLDAGIAMALYPEAGKPRIEIDLKTIRATGMEFDYRLVRMAKVRE